MKKPQQEYKRYGAAFLTTEQWEKAALFCGFRSVSEYRLWIAKLKREKRKNNG